MLSNRPARRESGHAWRCRIIARQPVSIVGRPRKRRFRFPHDIRDAPMILPGHPLVEALLARGEDDILAMGDLHDD